jgi:hypothetical protein
VEVVGNLAYVCDYNYGLEIINVTDVSNLYNVSTLDWGGSPRSVEVVGHFAYVADYNNGLAIINVSDPINPYNVSHLSDGGSARDVQVVGNLAYVADYDDGLEIIDITDPTNPTEIGQFYDGSGQAFGVQVVGPLAYVADDKDGLEIIDISDPANLIEIGAYTDNYNLTRELQVVGNRVFLADGSDGLEIIDVTDPSNPIEVGQYNDSTGSATGLHVVGDRVYLADYGGGLEIIEGHAPAANSPPNATHALGASGEVINWTLGDNIAGGYYRVFRNETLHADWQPWSDDTNLSVPVNTTTLGVWNYTIQYNDSVGIWGTPDMVLITIEDLTPPWHSNPPVVPYAVDDTVDIVWTLYDNLAGGFYQVLRNDTPVGVWNSWTDGIPFNVNINTTTVGVWNYTISYNDSVGLWGTPDTVLITIEDPIAPWSSTPYPETFAVGEIALINWTLYDNYDEGKCHVYVNETPLATWFSWFNNSAFYVNVNTTAPAVLNYTIHFNDSVGLWGTPSSVLITIEDPIAPWSSTPSNEPYEQDSSASITWRLYDNYAGGFYRVLREDNPLGGWSEWSNNTPLVIPVDTSTLGTWNYTIQYNDSVGLWGIADTVFITIEEKTTDGIPGFELFFGIIGLVAFVLTYYRKKILA